MAASFAAVSGSPVVRNVTPVRSVLFRFAANANRSAELGEVTIAHPLQQGPWVTQGRIADSSPTGTYVCGGNLIPHMRAPALMARSWAYGKRPRSCLSQRTGTAFLAAAFRTVAVPISRDSGYHTTTGRPSNPYAVQVTAVCSAFKRPVATGMDVGIPRLRVPPDDASMPGRARGL